jgi:protein-disulfide isomerase
MIVPSQVTNARGIGRVVLVEFADYECPFCARHAQSTAPSIKKAFLDSGGIRHVFFNFPLDSHPRAQKAGEAAECAARQGRFWEMHELLFADQSEGALEVSEITKRAAGLNLDHVKFTHCLESGETAEKVRVDRALGKKLGVSSTPSFFVGTFDGNGTISLTKRINGAVPYERFEEVLQQLLNSTGRS